MSGFARVISWVREWCSSKPRQIIAKEMECIRGSFDIHVTVDGSQMYRFLAFCNEHHIGSTYVVGTDDIQQESPGTHRHQQLMTSEHTKETNLSAKIAIQRGLQLANTMKTHGIRVLRVKVESKAESEGIQDFLRSRLCLQHKNVHYFEFHLKLINKSGSLQEAVRLSNICKKYGLSCALNAWKHSKCLDPFVAYRVHASSVAEALQSNENLMQKLKVQDNIDIDETNIHKEFTVFDTNPRLDRGFVPCIHRV